MSKLGMPCSVLSSLHFPTSVMWSFCLPLTFSHLFSCPTPTPSFLACSTFSFHCWTGSVNRQNKISRFPLAIKEATLWNSDASWMFSVASGMSVILNVSQEMKENKYRATSLCFHSPYHGLWVLGKRLTTSFSTSYQRGAKKCTSRRYILSLSDSVLCATFDKRPQNSLHSLTEMQE